MDLGIFDRFDPSLKPRELIEKIKFDMNRSYKHNGRYVIPMNRKNVWTNKWMQDPRKNFLQTSYHDSGAQYKRSWGSFKRKRGLTLCYNCRKPRHLAKEFSNRGPSCLFCKAIDHEVLDFPRMIAKLEGMNLNPKVDPKIIEPQKESKKLLIQMKETLNEHRHVILSEIFKENECIEVRIGDFDIDCVLDEETKMNIMTERTWEAIGRPTMIPSLGGIGLFRGKLVNLCGRLTQIYTNAKETLTEEDFEIITFIEDSALFTMLLGKPWIDRRKEEVEVLELKKHGLKDFMTKNIAQLIEEQKNRSKLLDTRDPNVKVERMSQGSQKTEAPVPEKEKLLPWRESQQRALTMLKEDRNQNGKRQTELKITRKKARNLSKNRAKIENLQEIPDGTS
jgi:hypothetical protein